MFDERERAEEAKFALDQELRFKAMVRRDRLLGLWAARLLHRTGEAADSYAADIVKSDLEAPGDEEVFQKVRDDFAAAGVTLTDHQIHRQMSELMDVAIRQVKSGQSSPGLA